MSLSLKEIFDLDEKRTQETWEQSGGVIWVAAVTEDGHGGWEQYQQQIASANEPDAQYIAAMPDAVKHLRRLEAVLDNILEIVEEQIIFERDELKDMRESGDNNSYGAGFSTGVITAMQEIKNALQLNEAK